MRRRLLVVALAVGALGLGAPGTAQATDVPTTTAAKPGVCWFLDWPEPRDVCVHRPGLLDLLP